MIKILLLAVLILGPAPILAQHGGHTKPHTMLPAPLGVPMERLGSGTTWLPDSSPMYAVHQMWGSWAAMLHGQAFLQYNTQGSRRGANQFGSINWGMAMVSRDFGKPTSQGNTSNRIAFRTMLSLDPLTITERGYPLLLQTGESYNGSPLHDRQHPHDLFMELAAIYDRQLTQSLGLQLYVAPVGEPAIGPVAFMHRPSAANDPFAPLAHHWQDATHISFGVLTAGLFTKTTKLEGSWFNGREPDQHRYDFDFRRLDSYSGRLTVNPNTHWSFQSSYAFLKSPEILEPDESQHRSTSSALYGRPFGVNGDWSTAIVYGANKPSGESASYSWLAESNLNLNNRNAIFGRAELVQKSSEDLDLPASAGDRRFNVGALVLGYVRELWTGSIGSLGLGARGSINMVPDELQPYYGTKTPLGVGIFFRYRPNRMRHTMQPAKQHTTPAPMHTPMPMPESPTSSTPMDSTTHKSAMPSMAAPKMVMPADSAKMSAETDSIKTDSTTKAFGKTQPKSRIKKKAVPKKTPAKKTPPKKAPPMTKPMPGMDHK